MEKDVKVLSVYDAEFLKKIMRLFGINRIAIGWSDSTKRYPDIWCYPYETPPRIVLTQEWRRQSTMERQKRLVHEFLHIRGMEHGRKGIYDYNTIPEKDSYSMMVYRQLCGQ